MPIWHPLPQFPNLGAQHVWADILQIHISQLVRMFLHSLSLEPVYSPLWLDLLYSSHWLQGHRSIFNSPDQPQGDISTIRISMEDCLCNEPISLPDSISLQDHLWDPEHSIPLFSHSHVNSPLMALYRAYQQLCPLEQLPGTEQIWQTIKANLIAAIDQLCGASFWDEIESIHQEIRVALVWLGGVCKFRADWESLFRHYKVI